jgi:hypothetical protein
MAAVGMQTEVAAAQRPLSALSPPLATPVWSVPVGLVPVVSTSVVSAVPAAFAVPEAFTLPDASVVLVPLPPADSTVWNNCE